MQLAIFNFGHSFLEAFLSASIILTLFNIHVRQKSYSVIKYAFFISLTVFLLNFLDTALWLRIPIILLVASILIAFFCRLRYLEAFVVHFFSWIIILFAEIIVFLVFNFGFGISIGDVVENSVRFFMIAGVAHLLILALILCVFHKVDNRHFQELYKTLIKIQKSRKEQVIIFLFILLISQITVSFLLIVNTLFEVQETGNYILLGLFLLLLVIIFLTFSVIERTVNYIQEDAGKSYMRNIEDMFMAFKIQQASYTNELQVLTGYLQQNQTSAMKEYLEELVGKTKQNNLFLYLGNPSVSALLKAKMTIYEQKGTVLSVESNSSLTDLPISDYDLIRLLGLVLDNIQAEAINLSFQIDKGQFLIRIGTKENLEVINKFKEGYKRHFFEPIDKNELVGYILKKHRGKIYESKRNGLHYINILFPRKNLTA